METELLPVAAPAGEEPGMSDKRRERTQSMNTQSTEPKKSRASQVEAELGHLGEDLLSEQLPASQAGGQASKGAGKAKEQAAKEDKSDKKEELKLVQITAALTQLVLTNSRSIAVLQSIAIRVIKFHKELIDMCSATKPVTQRYAAHVKQLTKEDKADFFPPHLFVWSAIIGLLSQKAKDILPTMEIHAEVNKLGSAVTEYCKEIGDIAVQMCKDQKVEETASNLKRMNMTVLSYQLKYCRVVQCWDNTVQRLELSAIAGSASHRLIDILFRMIEILAMGRQLPNQAPRGKLERLLGSWLDSARKSKKVDLTALDSLVKQ